MAMRGLLIVGFAIVGLTAENDAIAQTSLQQQTLVQSDPCAEMSGEGLSLCGCAC